MDRRRVELERSWPRRTGEQGRLDALASERRPLREEQSRLLLRVPSWRPPRPGCGSTTTRATRRWPRRSSTSSRWRCRRSASGSSPIGRRAWRRARRRAAERAAADPAARDRGPLAGLGYTEPAYREARDAEARAERDPREAELALVARGASSAAAEEASSPPCAARAERVEREREVEAAGIELALHQELDRALTDLRTELNAALRPDLSELASGFLRDLTNGRYTDLELERITAPRCSTTAIPRR